jgi:hypothetical protein
MLLRVGMAHSNGSGHTAGFVDHIDIDAQDFGHLPMDDAVAGVGAAAGPPDHHRGDIAFWETLWQPWPHPWSTASRTIRLTNRIFFIFIPPFRMV